jgi:cytochrome c oxidase subunit 2
MGKIIAGVVILGIAVAGYFFLQNEKSMPMTSQTGPLSQENTSLEMESNSIKDFTMTAYYDETGVWFSLKEMRVKEGDRVRIHITNTKGMHDFVIDELGVSQELPLNEEVTVEFIAEKKGDFVFYCSKPGHKAKGQWGTLIVE